MTVLKQLGQPAMAGRPYQAALAQLLAIGWTTQDWDDLDDYRTWGQVDEQNHQRVRYWLRHPPERFDVPVSPGLVRETTARYGRQTPGALNAYAAGASERFVAAHLAHGLRVLNADIAWGACRHSSLSEVSSTGWALTGQLVVVDTGTTWTGLLDRILQWAALFGEFAYLWVLAGFTFEEATVMQAAGPPASKDQLRVMAALNGFTLPAGI
ncbi:MAG: hypothetical protein ACOH1Y_16925 [Propionicimonas sp.]